MNKIMILSTLIFSIIFLSACDVHLSDDSNTHGDFIVNKTSIVNEGSEIIWNVEIINAVQDSFRKSIFIYPYNSSKYNYETSEYKHNIELVCNQYVNGKYINCDSIDTIVCERGQIGSSYSDYTCFFVSNGYAYANNQKKMRISVYSDNGNSGTLMNLAYFEKGNVEYYLANEDKTMMFDMLTGGFGE